MQYSQHTDSLVSRAFQTLLSHRQSTCLLVDSCGRLLAVCDDCLSLLARSAELHQGTAVSKLLPADLESPIQTVLQQAQTSGYARDEYSSQLADGVPVVIEAHLHPASGAIDEFFVLLIERCDRIHNFPVPGTPELIEVNKRLRAEILERQQAEQELAKKAEALARSNADLEEFAYVVSHDLQEPLRAMTAFSQLLDQRYKQHLDTSAKRYIKHIVDGGSRMKAMIDGILELSRINNAQLDSSPTCFEQALEVVLENLKLICLETHTTITHDTLPTLCVDKNHVVQLFQNLISNAIKFRGPDPPDIHIVAKQQVNNWLFCVQDNGIGIPNDQQTRIFKLFQRLHNQQEHKGYGIGLAICKKIVEHYQGSIWLESAPAKGSVFYFTLVSCPKEA
ncbi:MAG: ATP-binding protein [Cyanobacteria bacterium P01_H01_bin.21]